MILQLMKRDIGWGAIPWLCGAAALLTVFMPMTPLLAGFAVPFYTIIFMRALPHQRATFFEAALPVSARELLLARFLTLMALVWPPVAIACAILSVQRHNRDIIGVVIAIATAMTLVLVSILAIRPRQFAAPAWMTMFSPAIAMVVVVPGLSTGHTWATTLVCGAGAVLLGAYIWKNVPETFQSAPETVSAGRASGGSGTVSIPWWPLIRSSFSWQFLIFVPLSVMWVSTSDWIFGTMYMMLAYNQARMNSRWTQALPVPRRTKFAFILFPLILMLGAGTEAGLLLGLPQKNHPLVRLGDPQHFRATGMVDVFVAYEFWRVAPHGVAPEIVAPWGERYRPDAMRVLGFPLYNPYSVGANNSARFQEWQFARATSDIFGEAMTARELAHRKTRGLTPITARLRMQILSVATVIGMSLLWVWLIEFCSWHRLNRLPIRWRTGFTTTLILIPVGTAIYLDWAVSGSNGLTRGLVQAALLAVSRHTPANLVAVSALAVLPLFGLYWLIERQSSVAEDSQKAQQTQTGMLGQGWGRSC